LARSRSQKQLFSKTSFDQILPDIFSYRKYVFAYLAYSEIPKLSKYTNATGIGRHAVASVAASRYREDLLAEAFENSVAAILQSVLPKWTGFESFARGQKHNQVGFFKNVFDKETGQQIVETNWTAYYKGGTLKDDLVNFFSL
jgi:hypothetical protein